MSAPTVQEVAMPGLEMLGITSLDEDEGAPQARPIDLRNVAHVMTQTWGEIFRHGPLEQRERPGSGYLHAPASLTLSATIGSTAISAVTTWAAWMAGCTARIAGDDRDNELLSATLLARPFTGPTGATTATVFGDSLTLDSTISKVISPMLCGGGSPVVEATDRATFLRCGYSVVPPYTGISFFNAGPKLSGSFPSVFFLDSFYDPTLDCVARRIRFSPMPMTALSVEFTASINPPRVMVSDIKGVGSADPGTKMPMIDGAVETIFLPIFMQFLTRLPTFRNADAKPEIFRQYTEAIKDLKSRQASVSSVMPQYT